MGAIPAVDATGAVDPVAALEPSQVQPPVRQ
jgi:hypothetical protein